MTKNNTATIAPLNTLRKGVLVPMTEGQHRNLKVRAAQMGVTLQSILSDLLSDALAKEADDNRRSRRLSE